MFGTYFLAVAAALRDLQCKLPSTQRAIRRAAPLLPDRLPPGSWRSRSAFLLSQRRPPSTSAVLAPLPQDSALQSRHAS